MADFTSALFLDARHPTDRLRPWASLTTGRPAAVDEPPAARLLAERFAGRHGSEAGVLHRSALHALWDVVDLCARRGAALVLDAAAYPLSQWAAAGAMARGVPVASFAHHDVDDLVRVTSGTRRRPVVVTDGWCPDCGLAAPLLDAAAAISHRGATLVVDDSLACGVLGASPSARQPFGYGGGGTLRWLGATGTGAGGVVQIASLGKAYGAPLAVTTGPEAIVEPLRSHGTRWHSSPASSVDLAAGLSATADEHGNDRRRGWLARLVTTLRDGLASLGLPVAGLPFPMVSIGGPGRWVRVLYEVLAQAGVRSLLRRPRCWGGSAVTFAVTSGHRLADVDRVLDVVSSMPVHLLRRAS